MSKKISIIVPIYNVEKYLEDCIESLINQTYKNLEILLVNDGSKDGCLEICKEYEQRDSRVIVLDQPNMGANAARNNGLRHATGDWILFMDGDDWLDVNACEEISASFDDKMDMVCFNLRYCYPNKTQDCACQKDPFFIEEGDFTEMQYATLNRMGSYKYNYRVINTISVVDKAYRSDFLRNNNLSFDEKLPKLQDLLFSLHAYDFMKRAYYTGKTFYNYRIHNESVSKRYQENLVKKFDVIHQALEEFMDGRTDDKLIEAYWQRICTHARTCVVLHFCNKDNPKGYRKRKKDFLQTMEKEPFRTAMEKGDIRQFGVKEKVLSWFIKHRLFLGCEILCRLNQLKEKVR